MIKAKNMSLVQMTMYGIPKYVTWHNIHRLLHTFSLCWDTVSASGKRRSFLQWSWISRTQWHRHLWFHPEQTPAVFAAQHPSLLLWVRTLHFPGGSHAFTMLPMPTCLSLHGSSMQPQMGNQPWPTWRTGWEAQVSETHLLWASWYSRENGFVQWDAGLVAISLKKIPDFPGYHTYERNLWEQGKWSRGWRVTVIPRARGSRDERRKTRSTLIAPFQETGDLSFSFHKPAKGQMLRPLELRAGNASILCSGLHPGLARQTWGWSPGLPKDSLAVSENRLDPRGESLAPSSGSYLVSLILSSVKLISRKVE